MTTQFLQLRSGNSGAPFVGEHDLDTVLWSVAHAAWYVGPGGGAGAVSSVFGRVGAVVAASGDYDSDQVDNVSSVLGATVSDALETLALSTGAVDSVFGRAGIVVAVAGDYNSNEVDNASGVAGATVSDALDALDAQSGVSTVFGRSGAVAAVAGDYNSGQIDNVSGVTGATVSDALDLLDAQSGVNSVFGRTATVTAAAGDYDSDQVDNISGVPGTVVSDALDRLLEAPVVPYSGASNTLQLSDRGCYLRISHGSACDLHVPENGTVAFPIGTLIIVVQAGAGALTLVADGVVVLSKPTSRTLVFEEQGSQVALKKTGTNAWDVVGGLGT